MDDFTKAITDTVLQLAAVRKSRRHQLDELRLLRKQNKDVAAVERELQVNKVLLLNLIKRRKELGTKLIKSQGTKPSAGPPLKQI